MKFTVDKIEVMKLLEIIMETQSDEEDSWGNTSVKQQASDMLLTILRLPIWCDSVILEEDEALFLSEYV